MANISGHKGALKSITWMREDRLIVASDDHVVRCFSVLDDDDKQVREKNSLPLLQNICQSLVTIYVVDSFRMCRFLSAPPDFNVFSIRLLCIGQDVRVANRINDIVRLVFSSRRWSKRPIRPK